MAISYNDWKKKYEWLNDAQRQNYLNMTKNDATAQQYMTQYNNEKNTVYTPSTTQNVTQPSNTFWDTWGASQAKQYTGTWVTSAGNYNYNPNLKTNQLTSGSLVFWTNAENTESRTPWYLEQRNNAIANALYNEWKRDENSVRNYLNTFSDFRNYDTVWQNNTVTAIMKRMWNIINTQGGNWQQDLNSRLQSEIWDNYNNNKKWYSDLMWWWANYYNNFWDAVNGKLKEAYWINNLDEFRAKYPEQYESLQQALSNVEWVWNATDPNERQMLDGRLQAIIGSWVWAGSDFSKLKVLESTLIDKFKDPERIKQDAQNVIKLQTEWKNTQQIANEMWVSEDQVKQLILLANWLDSKAWEYYQLKDNVSKDITEPYDTKIARLEEEKKIALDRANRNVDWLKQDFDTNLERQKQQNDINAHNADAIAWRTWLAFSKRGIEWINYTATQAQQIIDDLTKNYDRNNQQMADGIADIIRNWQWNNQDLMKASEDALTRAKNSFTANTLAIQQQYWTVWLQAQQALANNVQAFITEAEWIYDNALARQQQNLSNLITNVSNLNALAAQNLTLRQAKIEQFQSESMNLNRNQLQSLASQLWMDTNNYQELVNYQEQAVANALNWYVPWAWMYFQQEIQSQLDQWYTPMQAMNNIMNSDDFKAMTQSSGWDSWAMSNWIMYNKSTWEYKDLSWNTWNKLNDNTLYNPATWQTMNVSDLWNSVGWGVSNTQSVQQWLQNFASGHPVDSTWGECGKFVNDYLESLWLDRVFVDPIDKKKAAINTDEWYTPQVWDIAVMNSPSSPQYWHVAIITWISQDKNGNTVLTTLESNKKWEKQVFSRTFTPNVSTATEVFGYYHPEVQGNINTPWDWAISDDWVTPISYRQRIYNLVPTSLKNSDTELKNLYATAKTLYQKWYTADEAALTFYWLDIKKDKTWLMNSLLWIARSSWSDLPDSFYWNLWQYLESWNAEQAIKLVENTVLWKDGAALEKNWISLVSKIKNVQEKLEEAKKYVWPINWTFTQYINKLKSNKKYQSLATAITNAYADVQKELMWSNLTEWEKSRYAPMFPEMSDKYDNIATKLQATIDNVLANVNWTRQYYSLPGLDAKTLLSNKERIWLYNWTYTIWWDNTIFTSSWRKISWWRS